MTKSVKTVRPATKTEQSVLDGFTTISARIKYLTGLNWTTTDIARKLGISYQHVNNEQGRVAKNPREQQPVVKRGK